MCAFKMSFKDTTLASAVEKQYGHIASNLIKLFFFFLLQDFKTLQSLSTMKKYLMRTVYKYMAYFRCESEARCTLYDLVLSTSTIGIFT